MPGHYGNGTKKVAKNAKKPTSSAQPKLKKGSDAMKKKMAQLRAKKGKK